MDDKVIVYVAGNPDAYPIEYYDTTTKTYQGVIPRLLQQFSEQSQYEVVYYETNTTDQREHLAQNLQVDLVSGYSDADSLPDGVQSTVLFNTLSDGTETAYSICFTGTASENLKMDLESYLSSVTQSTVTGLLLERPDMPHNHTAYHLTIGGLLLMIAMLIAVICIKVRKKQPSQLKEKSLYEVDPITGLGKNRYFIETYHQVINDNNRIHYSLVYINVDTERLHTLGRIEETAEFLHYCASILQKNIADADVIAKESGYGFLVLKYLSDEQKIEDWLQLVLPQLRGYALLHGNTFEARVTAGAYPLKAEDLTLNEIVSFARQGAYNAKADQMDYIICTDDILQEFVGQKFFHSDIERALQQHEIQLYIQFFVDAKSYKIAGGEALARWNHPQKGILTPDHFIPLLEKEKMICKLDYYCLNEVCVFLERLAEHGVNNFFVSCNFSRDTFAAEDFAQQCKAIIDCYHFEKKLLIFEITESVSDQNFAKIAKNMTALKEYGVRIALDDFGSGFTSFEDLQQYPVDAIKLDKALVDNILSVQGYAVLKAVTQMGHELGCVVLAEGAETDEQVQKLQNMNCDVIQGFYFYHPLPDADARAKILEQF